MKNISSLINSRYAQVKALILTQPGEHWFTPVTFHSYPRGLAPSFAQKKRKDFSCIDQYTIDRRRYFYIRFEVMQKINLRAEAS